MALLASRTLIAVLLVLVGRAHVDERRGLEQRLPAFVERDVARVVRHNCNVYIRLVRRPRRRTALLLGVVCLELAIAINKRCLQEASPLYQKPPFTKFFAYKQL